MSADLAALPQELAAQSLSRTTIILPYDGAMEALEQLTGSGRRVEIWEGWVKMRDGGRARSLMHGGTFALSPDARRAADSAKAGMTRARDHWQRSPEYPGADLYFGLTFGAADPAT